MEAAEELRHIESEFMKACAFPRLDADQSDCNNEMKQLVIQLNRFAMLFEKLVNEDTEAARLFGTLRQPLMQAQQRISSRHAQCLVMKAESTAFRKSAQATIKQLSSLMARTQKPPSTPQGQRVAHLLAETEALEGEANRLWD